MNKDPQEERILIRDRLPLPLIKNYPKKSEVQPALSRPVMGIGNEKADALISSLVDRGETTDGRE